MATHPSAGRGIHPGAHRPGRYRALSHYSPWDDIGERYPDWVVRIRDLQGAREVLSFDRRVVLVDVGPNAAVRRCSLAHALAHLDLDHCEAGDVLRFEQRQELAADKLAARRLIPLDRLLDTVRWTRSPLEACEELTVDLDTLQCRVDHLHPSERGAVRAAFAERDEGQ